eukprot:CAMPEP_0174890190 /NCGR_PEP_ID=MMETSP0167-20121228/5351_1 /TAXON_ID=38298 /ORGANISM="Rhodella maculata, Strain CCMP736" /LENGTH=75 /DNA_ID=CAMNT_0016127897 /DNA_START=74 /DNA_END=301 /DNA_ORIENTATION=-
MGGGPQRYLYPKEVWSPTGGPWAYPRNWKVNTAIGFCGMMLVHYTIYRLTAHKEERQAPAMAIPWRPSLKVKDEE